MIPALSRPSRPKATQTTLDYLADKSDHYGTQIAIEQMIPWVLFAAQSSAPPPSSLWSDSSWENGRHSYRHQWRLEINSA
jgi:hypothetical protein